MFLCHDGIHFIYSMKQEISTIKWNETKFKKLSTSHPYKQLKSKRNENKQCVACLKSICWNFVWIVFRSESEGGLCHWSSTIKTLPDSPSNLFWSIHYDIIHSQNRRYIFHWWSAHWHMACRQAREMPLIFHYKSASGKLGRRYTRHIYILFLKSRELSQFVDRFTRTYFLILYVMRIRIFCFTDVLPMFYRSDV